MRTDTPSDRRKGRFRKVIHTLSESLASVPPINYDVQIKGTAREGTDQGSLEMRNVRARQQAVVTALFELCCSLGVDLRGQTFSVGNQPGFLAVPHRNPRATVACRSLNLADAERAVRQAAQNA